MKKSASTEISLTPGPTMAETLYAQRLVAGEHPMPEAGDPVWTPGLRKAVAAATEQRNQNTTQVAQGAVDPSDAALVNQLLGQVQAMHAASGLLQTFGISKLAYVKETKAYKSLSGQKTNGLVLRGTWEEFCGLLGISDEKANQDIANLRAFGEEALESMSRMGIGYRDLAQYRRLPADAQGALIEAAKAGDKETLLDLAEQLIARQAAEKSELTTRAEGAEARAANLDVALEQATSRIARLEQATSKTRLTNFHPRTEAVRDECMAEQKAVEAHLAGLQTLFDEVMAEGVDEPEHQMRLDQVWVSAHLVASRALDLIAHMEAHVERVDMPDRILAQHCLTPAEAEKWLHDAPLIESRVAAERAAREQARAEGQPRKAGRPKGSKNKAKD